VGGGGPAPGPGPSGPLSRPHPTSATAVRRHRRKDPAVCHRDVSFASPRACPALLYCAL